MPNATVSEQIWTDDGEATGMGFTRHPYPSSPSRMSSPVPRATSPNLFPIRFNSQPNSHHGNRDTKSPDMFSSAKPGRLPVQLRTNDKGKEPVRGDALIDSIPPSPRNTGKDSVNAHYIASNPFPTYDRVRPQTTDGRINGLRKPRGSILVAASDALGFKFGRRRPVVRQPPMPIILPDVIEISAPRPDEEVEERNRLREMAAQAIGLGPFMTQPDSNSQESTEEGDNEDDLRSPFDNPEPRKFGDSKNFESSPEIASKIPYESNLSITIPTALPPNRFRSGSMIHTRTNSTTLTPIPSFPTNVLSLNPFLTSSGYFPKYHPPSSLRIFALSSKNWKSRYLILSSPTTLVTRNQSPAVSYLHLFKSSGPDDKELERLEINEDSVVFVAEEEVSGRRNVIKVGGVDVGSTKKEASNEDGGRTMWHLQITDPSEVQRWISSIKTAILGQRTVRAGLGIPPTPLGVEPRGDMDVMLSIRAQGFVGSNKTPSIHTANHIPQSMPLNADPNYASSVSSHSIRSQATIPKPIPSIAVSTLKGLFSSSRPRSASRAASVDSERHQVDRDQNEESFASMGSNLLNLLRSSTPDNQSIITSLNTPIQQRNTLPFAPTQSSVERRLDRKILSDRQPEQWNTPPNALPAPNKERANRALSLGALSLQPPPRRRWNSVRPTSATGHEDGFQRAWHDPVVTTVFGSRPSYEKAETEPPSSPTDFSFGTNEPRPRAPSLQSVSTYVSENAISIDRSSSSTKRSSNTNKRWSRQGVLPHRLTPPSGPPPAVPATSSLAKIHVHPYGADRPPSTTSSQSANSQRSVISSLPSFSKRASGSSSRSVKTSSTTGSFINLPATRHMGSHRTSIPPPPRPAPTAALPPAPDQNTPKTPEPSPPPTKSSFRNSVAQRAMRLSMIAPKPPPLTNLPPRPDELDNSRTHRRSSSGSTSRIQLDTILEPPNHAILPASPFPPPVGPLPPTPSIAQTPPQQITPPVSRHASLKQRLRILSTPSPVMGAFNLPSTRATASSSATPTSTPLTTMFTLSPPPTPFGEKITMFPNDPSFLQMNTPIITSLPPPRALDFLEEELNIITSLSPPPRRGSKQVLEVGVETSQLLSQNSLEPSEGEPSGITSLSPPPRRSSKPVTIEFPEPPAETPDVKLTAEGDPPRIFSLSRPGSVVSLRLVSL